MRDRTHEPPASHAQTNAAASTCARLHETVVSQEKKPEDDPDGDALLVSAKGLIGPKPSLVASESQEHVPFVLSLICRPLKPPPE